VRPRIARETSLLVMYDSEWDKHSDQCDRGYGDSDRESS
jgi:hypothetical protein